MLSPRLALSAAIPHQHIKMDGCEGVKLEVKLNNFALSSPNESSVLRPARKRLVEKNGKINVRSKHVPRNRYMQDLFTSLIDAKWKYVILLFLTVYLGSWLLFGFIWWSIVVSHGTKCLENVENFTEAFLLSVETSMTIGYGGRAVSSECSEAVVFLIIQALTSCLIDAIIIGLLFTKIARPIKRQSTIMFSKNAVVTMRDDKFCLMFRVADVRKRQLSECHVRLYLYRTYLTREGKVILNHQDQLRVGCDWYNLRDDSDRLFLMSPCTVVHVIDRKSPLYNISADMLARLDWEFVVVLEGNVEATGCTMQTRTSYLNSEVLWGYDFTDVLTRGEWEGRESLQYKIKRLDDREAVTYVPRCSPKEYYYRMNKSSDSNDEYGDQNVFFTEKKLAPLDEEIFILPSQQHINGSFVE